MKEELLYLNELNWGYRAGRVLHVACKLGLFDILEGNKKDAIEISAICEGKEEMVDKILIACTALGLLEKSGNKYSNAPIADSYLVKGKELYQGNMIAHSANVWNFWSDLPNAVISEEAKPRQIDEHRNFIMGMANITAGGRGQIFSITSTFPDERKCSMLAAGPVCILYWHAGNGSR